MGNAAKIDAIIRATGELIDESGLEGLTTTEVARRAGVSTATLYRHFPDKHQVLRELVQRLHAERQKQSVLILKRFSSEPDWRGAIESLIRTTHALRMAQPGGRTTRRVLHYSPELRDWDLADTRELSHQLALAIRRRKPGITTANAESMSLAVVVAIVALLDMACVDTRRAKKLIDETVGVACAYLAAALD
jgi:AcrR family transcriptional regulator